jgi:hypothetical protein
MEKQPLPKRRYTQDEASVIEKVRSDFNSAKKSRENNSYWGAPSTTGDWEQRWDLQEKIDMGWSEAPKQDEFESNVKSPMASGRIESTMHKLRRLDLRFVVRPDNVKDPKDKRKARVVQELLNNLFERRDYKSRLMTWFKDCLIHGSAFMHVYYLRKKRTVQMPKTDVKQMSEEEKEKLKNREKVYEKEVVYDYDDIAFEPVKIQEIFVDPSARNLHGTSYEAQWIIRRMLPSLSQFKAMYSADPDAKNINKVRPVSHYVGEETEFFEPPKDVDNDDYVELLHYYNKAEDKYVVLANDVLIKEMPLPYKHKQLPFVKIDAYEVLHQFYGMGIPDRLMNIQSEEEILKNLVYDRLHITANPIIKVKKNIYGEFSKAYQTAEPGLMVPVNQQDDVMPLEYQSMNFDMFRGIDALNRDAVLATQIDPIQMGVNQKYVSATTSMLTKEQMDTYITSLIDTWTEPLNMAAKQCVSLMSQFYTTPRVEKAGKSAKSRQIRLLDIEVNPNTLEVKEKRGKYTYLEIKPDFFDIHGDWAIEIAPESVEVQSKAIEMQKSQAALAQLAPFMVDANNPMAAMSNPMGWVDGPKTLEWYMETNGIPKELMAVLTEDEDISTERAELQGKKILAGEPVPGMAGEPEIHKKVHVDQLRIINGKKREVEKAFEQYPPDLMEYMLNSPQGQQLKELDTIANMLANHLMEDDQPKAMEVQGAVQGAQPPAPPQVPMPPGLTPAGGQPPATPVGGNQQSGMQPEVPPQGRPPMAETGI